MKFSFTIVIAILAFGQAFGQNYTRAVGARGGKSPSLTYRLNVDNDHAFEWTLGYRKAGMQAAAFKATYRPAHFTRSNNFFWSMGFGLHAGWSYTNKYDFFFIKFYYDEKKFAPFLG
ncbi:MAG: hypothetical protein HC896_12410 [Bacteroidales bacterium]|nr:hypothetical protein [Bacteroidales bacterium]